VSDELRVVSAVPGRLWAVSYGAWWVLWFRFGVDEVVEHLGEAFAAGLFYVYGSGEFGDGGELALILVELDCVDEVNGRRIGGRLAAVRVRPVINFIPMESKVSEGCATSQSMDAWEKRSGAAIRAM
jgi:hypothetical protein